MPITEHDIPSDPSKTTYPIFWEVVRERGRAAVSGLEPRDRKWIEQEPITLKRLLTGKGRKRYVKQEGGGRS